MKLNFSKQNLFQDGGFPAQVAGPSIHLTYGKLKGWWEGLSLEKREQICKLDTSEVIHDLPDTANNALLVCKFHHTYKKKDLISWEKIHNKDQDTNTQSFEYNLIGKEILEKDLADLFSSFYISITRSQAAGEPSFNTGAPSATKPCSSVGIKKEKLPTILDLLAKFVQNFAGGEKFIFQKEDLPWLCFSWTQNVKQQMLFSPSIPKYFKELFECLTVCCFLLEQQIYLAYYTTLQFGNNPKIDYLQVMRDNQSSVEPNEDRESTASGSSRYFPSSAYLENYELEELNQKLAKKISVDPLGGMEFSYQDSNYEEAKVPIDDFDLKSRRSSPDETTMFPEFFSEVIDYRGCLMGNLEIPFDPTDALLIEHEDFTACEEAIYREEGCGEPQMGGFVPSDFGGFNNNMQYQPPLQPFYCMPNPMMMMMPQAPFYPQPQFQDPNMPPQNQLSYPMMPNECPQNFPMEPSNGFYGGFQPMGFMPPQENIPFEVQENQQQIYQDNYQGGGEQQSNYCEDYNNNNNHHNRGQYFHNRQDNGYKGNGQYYQSGGRGKPRYDSRSQLPPRFQKQKNMYRN